MRLRCPKCATTYSVDDELITGTSPTFRCSRCKHVFVVEARAATDKEQRLDGVIDTASPAQESGNPASDAPDSLDSAEIDRPRTKPGDADDQLEPQGGLPLQPTTGKPVPMREGENRGGKNDTSFETGEDFFIFPKDENQEDTDQARTGGQISVLPFVSLFAILLFVFSLVTMTYQVDPAPLESLIRQIPWYGSTIFESRHFKRRLELESLTSGLRSVLGQREVFIISGTLVNRNARGVKNVRIEAQIYDGSGKPLGRQTIYLGNAISSNIIQDMTPREISLLQSLKPQNVYRIDPNDSASFTIVLPKPEGDVDSFTCRVISAEVTA